jgi:NitT/TauT family transport system substrate-binding protein
LIHEAERLGKVVLPAKMRILERLAPGPSPRYATGIGHPDRGCPMRRILRLTLAAFTIALAMAGFGGSAGAADAVSFGIDWRAEAEHGGYYQAIATGLYEKYGIAVTLKQGGPQANQAQLFAAGRLDFNLAPNSFIPLNFLQEGIPMLAVTAFFQKDPQALIAHPGQGNDSLAALKGKPIMIGADTRVGSWLFLKAKFGYTDDQIRPYANSVGPFLANPKAIQQGYAISEPYVIEQEGEKPVVMLLADNGYPSYASIVMTSARLAAEKPDLVRRFVAASAEGWSSYLNGDPAPAHALIKRDNPEMTDAILAFGREKLKSYGMVDSGDAQRLGLGAMTEARWREFFTTMAGQGIYPADLDYRKAYSLAFIGGKPEQKPEREEHR